MTRNTILLFLIIFFLGACAGVNGVAEENAKEDSDDYFDFFFPNEGARIKLYEQFVKRDGDTLRLKLSSGGVANLSDGEDCEVPPDICNGYQFLNYYMDEGLYLVFVKRYEGYDYLMVSDSSGKRYHIHDFPEFSPNRRRIVVASADETGYGPNGVFVWRRDTGALTPELSYEPEEYALYSFVGWVGNDAVLLSKYAKSDKELCPETNYMTIPATLKRDKGQWRLIDDPLAGNVKCE